MARYPDTVPTPVVRVCYPPQVASELFTTCSWVLNPRDEFVVEEGAPMCSGDIVYWMTDTWDAVAGLCPFHMAELRRLRPEWIARIESAI